MPNTVTSATAETATPSQMESGEQKTGQLQGREVVILPASHQEGRVTVKHKIGLGTLCLIDTAVFITGAVMAGVCSDPRTDGCSPPIKNSGIAMITISILAASITCCFLYCLSGSGSTESKK